MFGLTLFELCSLWQTKAMASLQVQLVRCHLCSSATELIITEYFQEHSSEFTLAQKISRAPYLKLI